MKKNIVFLCVALLSQLQYAQDVYYDVTIGGYYFNFDGCGNGEGIFGVYVFYDTGTDNYDELYSGDLINDAKLEFKLRTNKKIFRTQVRSR